MTLDLVSHLYARTAAAFLGFFSGGALFVLFVFGKHDLHIGITFVLFFGLIFGGTYLAQRAFSLAFPAVCPACGAANAIPTRRKSTLYACRTCGSENNAMRALMTRQFAAMQAGQSDKSDARLLWVFVFIGGGLLGTGIWLAQDAIDLQRHGISTPGKVIRVTQRPSRDSKGRAETSYTAFVDYKVGVVPYTLTTSSSVQAGTDCGSPCYEKNQSVKVIYMPGEPSQAKVHTLSSLFLVPGMFSGFGLLFGGFGVLALRHLRRKRLKAQSLATE